MSNTSTSSPVARRPARVPEDPRRGAATAFLRRRRPHALRGFAAHRTVRLRALLLCAGLALAAADARAATFIVDYTGDTVDLTPGNGVCQDALGHCSLRAAIMEANATAAADVIIVPRGVYTLVRGGADENEGATGDLDVLNPLTITGATGNPADVVVDGGSIDKVLSVNPYFTAAFATTLQHLTLRNGRNRSSSSGDGYGGAMDWDGAGSGTLTMTNCVVVNSVAEQGGGGGLAVFQGTATLTHTRIAGNAAVRDSGGGVLVGLSATLQLEDVVVVDNTSGNGGGGVFIAGNAGAGTHSIKRSTLAGNSATGSVAQGGGLYSTGAIELTNSTVSGNTARQGGGLWVNTFAGSPITLRNVTVTANTGSAGAGGLHYGDSGGTVTLHNTLLAANAGGDVAGPLAPASGYNLVGICGACGLVNGINGNQVGVVSPGVGALTTVGGWHRVHLLQPGSPAFEAGSNALVAGPLDQRGAPRMADAVQDADLVDEVEIGAVEMHPTLADVADRRMPSGTTLAFDVSVADGDLGLACAASSSNPAVVPDANLSCDGSGPAVRVLSITPAGPTGTATITVTVTAAGLSASDTFVLTVDPPLPVALSSLTATADEADVVLAWRTESETNNAGFDVEHRLAPDAAWTRLGFVAGAGTAVAARRYTYRAGGLAPGVHRFRLRQVDYDGAFDYSPEVEAVVRVPRRLTLEESYPNPFGASAHVAFTVPERGPATLRVFDALGRGVAVLFDGEAEAGRRYGCILEGGGLPAGIYLYVLSYGGRQLTRRTVRIR